MTIFNIFDTFDTFDTFVCFRGRMIPSELERLVKERLDMGHRPYFVNCTEGTTVVGAFDPIHPIADICDKYGLWLHIDVRTVLSIPLILSWELFFDTFATPLRALVILINCYHYNIITDRKMTPEQNFCSVELPEERGKFFPCSSLVSLVCHNHASLFQFSSIHEMWH